VAVDIRRGSPTFGQWAAAEISAADRNQILIPTGFAHGLCTLEPNTEVIYKVTNYYSAKYDFGIRWNDPDLNIPWPVGQDQAQMSDRDTRHPFLKEAEILF
jgi:dTDP-4-dehydrorhamnose 3,5-epimerase